MPAVEKGAELDALAPTAQVSLKSPPCCALASSRGNNDRGAWAEALAETELTRFDDVLIYVIRDLAQLDIDPGAAGVRVVVSGRTHKPLIEERAGVLFINPGSAGPRRFRLPISIGELTIAGKSVSARTMKLGVQNAA